MTDYNEFISAFFSRADAEWKSIAVNGVTYTVFALPYTQLDFPPEGYAFVDSYYVASNRAYFLRKELVQKLTQAGFETVECTLPYKSVAYHSGLGVPLRSTLIANKKFGTRMALEIVGVRGVYAKEVSVETVLQKPEMAAFCRSCGICESVCPRGCISAEEFDRDKCIRSVQESADLSDKVAAEAMGTQLWGCDICQRCCPFNSHLKSREMTKEEKELFNIDNLYKAFSSGKKGCEPYRDILGGNYLRPAKLTALVLNVMANSKDPERYRKNAEDSIKHNDIRVQTAAKILLDKTTGY